MDWYFTKYEHYIDSVDWQLKSEFIDIGFHFDFVSVYVFLIPRNHGEKKTHNLIQTFPSKYYGFLKILEFLASHSEMLKC